MLMEFLIKLREMYVLDRSIDNKYMMIMLSGVVWRGQLGRTSSSALELLVLASCRNTLVLSLCN